MEKNLLKELLANYINGTCNDDEREKLARMIRRLDNNLLKEALSEVWMEYESHEQLSHEHSEQILAAILSAKQATLIPQKSIRRRILVAVTSVAASLILLLGLGYFMQQQLQSDAVVLFKADSVPLSQGVSYLRNVLLPDSSRVVLQAHSTIEILPTFNGKTREIQLIGEAFFDIKQDARKPFVIYSGQLKTTVLGTAFNIVAWPDEEQIRVTVTRGKVRVEDTGHVLANLSSNEEIEYNKSKLIGQKHTDVPATQKVIDWTKQDMEFHGMSIKDISAILSKRYNVDIEIRGNKLANTLIVASFSGTETLEKVLGTLCSINHATTYSIELDKVAIYQPD
jgi:ferric-dicitrate binding protein FerR (iron transport regulator)